MNEYNCYNCYYCMWYYCGCESPMAMKLSARDRAKKLKVRNESEL